MVKSTFHCFRIVRTGDSNHVAICPVAERSEKRHFYDFREEENLLNNTLTHTGPNRDLNLLIDLY